MKFKVVSNKTKLTEHGQVSYDVGPISHWMLTYLNSV